LKNGDQRANEPSSQDHNVLKVRFDPEPLAQYRVYSICCHNLLSYYEELSNACDIDTLIAGFDEALRSSYYGADYDLTIVNVDLSFQKLRNNYSSNPDACDIIESIRQAILHERDVWDFCVPLTEFRNIGRGLAQDFYHEGGRTLNKDLMDIRNPPMIFSNFWQTSRPAGSWSDGIYIPFTPDFTFAYYLSYPFVFFHEYASHWYAPEIDDRRFSEGWMMYAVELFMHNRWAKLSQKYSLICAQRKVERKFWLPRYGRLATKGYWIAEDVDVWIGDTDRFLQYTWDLASYPSDLAGHMSFHDDFLDLITRFTQRDTGHLLCSAVESSADALQLYETLSKIRFNQ
jgi:hypothetical protein